ncbi:MAG: glycine oxidase ThiO [Chloroflexi bacterium]|nr:glycine oxidase ThiO [Chloroflexota bacterium]
MAAASRVIVVGGGIIGCAVAYYLSEAGVKVSVFERGRLGHGASRAAAGMLSPLGEIHGPGPFLDLGLRSLRMYKGLAQELEERAGVDIEYVESGILRVAADEAGALALRSALEWQNRLGLDSRWLGEDEVRNLEPGLSSNVKGGVLSPREAHVNSLRVVEAFAQAAARRGVSFKVGASVTGLLTSGNRVTGVVAEGQKMQADFVVLAGGAWAGSLAGLVGLDLPVRPVRGQALLVHSVPAILRNVVFGPGSYLVPQKDGSLLVGATQEEAGFDDRVTAEGVQRLLQRGMALVPCLKDATFVTAWSGLRPGSPDGHPIIGPVKEWQGLVLAAGHFRNGVLLAPATGQLVRDYIVEGVTAPLKPLGLERFAARQ